MKKFAAVLLLALVACKPLPPETPPVKVVTLSVRAGTIVAWDPNPVDASWAALEAGCLGEVLVDAHWTGGPKHGKTWPFKVDGSKKEIGLDFSKPFGITEDC